MSVLKKSMLIKWSVITMVGLTLVFSTACQRTSPSGPAEVPTPPDESNRKEQEAVTSPESETVDQIYYVLYLKHRDQPFIFSDTRSIREDAPELNDRSLAAFVVEELIQQQGVGELVNPIPSETKLLSILQDGRTTTVNLSNEFAERMEGTVEDTEATIAMLVNSLITLPGIDRVILQIEGVTPDKINGLSIRNIYEFMTDYYPDK